MAQAVELLPSKEERPELKTPVTTNGKKKN
jgi:hypothetical protein